MTLTVTDWIAWDDAEGKPEAPIGGFGGYFEDGMRWPDLHLARLPHALALRDAIIAQDIKRAGDWHQSEGVPLFSDGTVAMFSCRAWGDFLAAVWSTELGIDLNYMAFYWGEVSL